MDAVQTNFETAQGNNPEAGEEQLATNWSLIYRMAHRYQNRNKAKLHYDKHLPLSVVIFAMDALDSAASSYGICYTHRNEVFVMPVERIPGSMFLVGGKVEYWQWALHREFQNHIPIESVRIMDYGMLLPLNAEATHQAGNHLGSYYTLTTHYWNREGVVHY